MELLGNSGVVLQQDCLRVRTRVHGACTSVHGGLVLSSLAAVVDVASAYGSIAACINPGVEVTIGCTMKGMVNLATDSADRDMKFELVPVYAHEGAIQCMMDAIADLSFPVRLLTMWRTIREMHLVVSSEAHGLIVAHVLKADNAMCTKKVSMPS